MDSTEMVMHAVGSDIVALGHENPSLKAKGPELVSKMGVPIPVAGSS